MFRTRLLLALTCSLMCFTTAKAAAQVTRYVVLPPSEARHVSRLCSRTVPMGITGGWRPSADDIRKLESQLPKLTSLRSKGGVVGVQISDPATYYRQYVGITLGERKLIYLNAFRDDKPPSHWHEELADYCDGATAFWGVLYDPDAQIFFDLQTNGRA